MRTYDIIVDGPALILLDLASLSGGGLCSLFGLLTFASQCILFFLDWTKIKESVQIERIRNQKAYGAEPVSR